MNYVLSLNMFYPKLIFWGFKTPSVSMLFQSESEWTVTLVSISRIEITYYLCTFLKSLSGVFIIDIVKNMLYYSIYVNKII